MGETTHAPIPLKLGDSAEVGRFPNSYRGSRKRGAMDNRNTQATPTRAAPLVEPGDAFMQLEGRRTTGGGGGERLDVIVIGAGQAGLVTGYHLKRRGLRFVILDGGERVGDAWRQRWDSLRLFTPSRYNGLAGMRFPGRSWYFPSKDEMADYLEAYAAKFSLPIRMRSRVEKLSQRDGDFVVQGKGFELRAAQVVIAMSSYQRPRVPAFAKALRPDIVQLHSLDYRSPAQLGAGGVLVVGAGNSGAEIALEAVRGHRTWLSGRDVGQVPFRVESTASRLVLIRLVIGFAFHYVLTVDTPIGRKVRPKVISHGLPLIRIKPREFDAAGIKRVARVAGVRDGLPVLEDGTVLDVGTVVWSTGFDHGLSWVDLPDLIGEDGEPRHRSGISTNYPGLYYVGQHFLHSASSTMIRGVSRDAARIAKAAARRYGAVSEQQRKPAFASL
jgi:putative flavoprotein involved in K+ transport